MKTIAVKARLKGEVLAHTSALCPHCMQTVPARRVRRGEQVYLERECPRHGHCEALIWDGPPDYRCWGGAGARRGVRGEASAGCPGSCGLCETHRRDTCCMLLEVTGRCNLGCPVCYASSGGGDGDPPLEELGRRLDVIVQRSGHCNLQLSGGEPTVRDDLPALVEMARARGFSYVQLNTNGLRLAGEKGYAAALKQAGLDCVFLQFDAMDDGAYTTLRGRPLLAEKQLAVERCTAAGLGVVLVPTLVAGVNDGQVGKILRYAVTHMPGVRGVHFQPISYFGRFPAGDRPRLTIPQVLRLIQQQTGGDMLAEHFGPGVAENPYCSFNGAYLLEPGGSLTPLNPRQGCCGGGAADGDVSGPRSYVARQWGRDGRENRPELRDQTPRSLDDFLARTGQYTLAVSGMAFQDPWTADLARLQECYIHVMKGGSEIYPFCACNLLHREGAT